MNEELVDLNVRYMEEVKDELPENIGALELLQLAYRGKVKLTPQQVRCAEAALPHETPKLSATAIATMDGKSFAEALERATARSESARNGAPLLNGSVEPLPAEVAQRPLQIFRRF
jgi:hypothetical protein